MMKVFEVNADDYRQLFCHPTHTYNSMAFVELNRRKCDELYRLVFSDGRVYAGLTVGRSDDELLSPFSAPFGGFDINREPSAARMIEIVAALEEWSRGRKCAITLPPAFYAPGLTEKSTYALQQARWHQESLINHHLTVVSPTKYISALESKSRNKLKRGMDCNHSFIRLDAKNCADIERAYRIISINRARKGYPLRMSLADVVATTPIARAEFFILCINGVDVASAQVYNVAPGIVQVIYWGDTGDASDCHPMNLLVYHLLEYYSGTEIKVIDIGPSGDFAGLNIGLADFKESIGCTPTLKFRFISNIS